MCCGGTTNTTTSSTSPPPGVANAYNSTISTAQQVAATPYQPYTGQRVADLTANQNAGIQSIQNNQGIGNPYLAQASQYANKGATPITSADIQANLNSTGLNQQVTALQNLFNQQNATANSVVTGNAASQGALGGDRVGVAQALTQQANALAQAPTLANAYNTAYGQAASLAQGNQAQQAAAAYTFGNLGQEAQNQSTTDAQNLLAAGGLQQQENQAQLNVPYQNYLTAQGYPFQTTQWLAGIEGALGPNLGSTSSTTQPPPSIWSQLLGAGSAGVGAYLASDARVKENISDPIGHLHDGTPVRSFNLKGDPKTQIGVIAQEAEKTSPGSVAQDPVTGIKMVDYNRVGRPQKGLGESAFSTGGPVDPDMARLTGHLGHAVEAMRYHLPPQPPPMQHMAGGGMVVPATPLQVQPLQLGNTVQAQSPVPGAEMQSGHMQGEQAPRPDTTGSTAQGNGLTSLGQGLGSYLARPPAPVYSDPGTAANGGWTTTAVPTSQGLSGWFDNLFADGGAVPHMAMGGSAAWPHGRVDDDSGSTAASPTPPTIDPPSPWSQQPAMASPFDLSNVPSSEVQPETIVPDAPLPPQATAYAPPAHVMGSGTQPPQQMGASGETAPQDESAPAKSWYEYGSNPTLGKALMAAGFATMGGQSPFAAVNIGQGGLAGVNAYVQQQQIERQAALLQIQAEKQAEIERHNQAIEANQAAGIPKFSADQFGRLYNVRTGQYKDSGLGGGAAGADLPTGDAFLEKYVPPQLRAQVKAIASYDAAPPAGIKGQALLDMVHQYNPNYSQNNYPVATAVKKDFSQAGATGKALYSAGTALRHLNGMNEAYQAMNNYQGWLSGPVNYGRSLWKKDISSDPQYQKALSSFKFHQEALSTELDKAFKGSGAPDVTGITGIKENFTPTASPAEFSGAVSAAVDLLKGRFDGANKAYQDSVGSPYPHPLLDDETQAIFDRLKTGGQDEAGGEKTSAATPPITRDDILKAPDGHKFVINGQLYSKHGTTLVPEGTP